MAEKRYMLTNETLTVTVSNIGAQIKSIKNRLISLGMYWPNIIHMAIALCMTPWCVWHRILIFAIRW